MVRVVVDVGGGFLDEFEEDIFKTRHQLHIQPQRISTEVTLLPHVHLHRGLDLHPKLTHKTQPEHPVLEYEPRWCGNFVLICHQLFGPFSPILLVHFQSFIHSFLREKVYWTPTRSRLFNDLAGAGFPVIILKPVISVLFTTRSGEMSRRNANNLSFVFLIILRVTNLLWLYRTKYLFELFNNSISLYKYCTRSKNFLEVFL